MSFVVVPSLLLSVVAILFSFKDTPLSDGWSARGVAAALNAAVGVGTMACLVTPTKTTSQLDDVVVMAWLITFLLSFLAVIFLPLWRTPACQCQNKKEG